MENDEEILRLEKKTCEETVRHQALWAGLKAGMRVADVGCGPGKTSRILYDLVQPGGQVSGLDVSAQRIEYAKNTYAGPGLDFFRYDILDDLNELGTFDFVWIRFVLEYHRSKAFEIVKNLSEILKPGGIICLIDLDYNCLNHFGLTDRLATALRGVMRCLEKSADFDPYVGIKLYSFLYDLGYQDIDVSLSPHHLIFGKLSEIDAFNWTQKVRVAARNSGYKFEEYPGGFDEFFEEFKSFFHDPRRFTYTPVISCRGIKPDNGS